MLVSFNIFVYTYRVLWLLVIHTVKALSIVKLLLKLFLSHDVEYFIFG